MEVVVEYVLGSKPIARVMYMNMKQLEIAETIRKEYIKAVPKPTWSGFIKYIGRSGVKFDYVKPDKVVGFLDLK